MMTDKQDPGEGGVAALPHTAEHPPTFESFGVFVQALEDGDLNAYLSDQLKAVGLALANYAANYGGKPKAQLKLTLDFTLDGGVHEIKPKVETKLPTPPRGRSMMWTDANGRFTPSNPKQAELFGQGNKPRAV